MASSTELSTTSQTRWWRPVGTGRSDVHPGPLADRLEALQDGHVAGAVAARTSRAVAFVLPHLHTAMDATFPTRGVNRTSQAPPPGDEIAGQRPEMSMTCIYQRGVIENGRRNGPSRSSALARPLSGTGWPATRIRISDTAGRAASRPASRASRSAVMKRSWAAQAG